VPSIKLTHHSQSSRLKTHIAGESLLNDRSAIVFFRIFKTLFLYDYNLEGGEKIDLGQGILAFLKLY